MDGLLIPFVCLLIVAAGVRGWWLEGEVARLRRENENLREKLNEVQSDYAALRFSKLKQESPAK